MNLSIAMCTYNGASYLREQLDSFLAQTRLPDELVVCDDCSKDETAKIIREFAESSPFPVRFFINEKNLGSTKNFENAIKACTGDIIFLSDQDDVWMPERLQKFEASFERDSEVGLVFCDAELVDKNLKPLDIRNWEILDFTRQDQRRLQQGDFSLLIYRNVVSGCAMAFRAEFKKLILPVPYNLHNVIHDYWVAILLSSVCKIDLISEPLVKYRQHTGQQIGVRDKLSGLNTDSNQKARTFSIAGLLEHLDHAYSFENALARLEAIRSRILLSEGKFYKNSINELTRHINHLRARTEIRNNLLLRVPVIIKELTLLRYHRYSSGIFSALKDLLFHKSEI